MRKFKLSKRQALNIKREIMSIKLHNYACDLLDKMERGGRLEAFQKELVKTVLDRDELEFIKADKCSCCGQPLAEYEEKKADCGHQCCNGCHYEKNEISYCSKCYEIHCKD